MSREPHHSEVEHALTSLAERLEFPSEPDIAGSVRAHIEEQPRSEERSVVTFPIARARTALAVAASVVAIATAALVFSPATRDAVADLIGLDGVRITHGPKPPEASLAEDLVPGELVSYEEANALLPFPVRLPSLLGLPDEVYVDGTGGDARLSLVYRVRDGLPPTKVAEVGAVVEQFRATIERGILSKQIYGRAGIRAVRVAGSEGYWLSGGPHQVTYLDPDGKATQDRSRLAGRTLLWEKDGFVYRLESGLALPRAIEIANSMF